MPNPTAILSVVIPLLVVFHIVIVLRNRGYEIRRIDHKDLTKHTGA